MSDILLAIVYLGVLVAFAIAGYWLGRYHKSKDDD